MVRRAPHSWALPATDAPFAAPAPARAAQDAVIFVDVRKGAALGQHTRAEEVRPPTPRRARACPRAPRAHAAPRRQPQTPPAPAAAPPRAAPAQFPSAVHFLGNGSVLLVGCASGVVDVARPRPDFRGAESVSTLHGHVQDVVALATDADSKLLASAGYDALITIWDAAAGVALATTPSIEYAVACLSFSCDGRRIAFAQEKGPVGVVAAPSGRVEGYVPAGASRAVAWNPRHAHILAYGSDDAGVWNNEGRPTFAGGAVGLAFFGRGGR